MSDIYDLRLPTHVADALLQLVRIAEEQQVLTLSVWRLVPSKEYTVALGESAGDREKMSIEKEDFLPGLSALGMIVFERKEEQRGSIIGTIFLTQKAYDWAHYQRRTALGRWWERALSWGKQAAPLLVGIAAIVLTILQIIQTIESLLQ